jgi:hypothetical protein
MGGDVTGAVTGLVVGPLLFGLFVGLFVRLTTLGAGVGWPMEPVAWMGVTSEAVMPAPENVNDWTA